MDVLDYDHNLHLSNKGDERLAVRFFMKAKQDPEKTIAEGRPIFVEMEYIQMMVPGDRETTHVRPVRHGDIQRFKRQYDHWKTTQTNDAVIGTPLELLGLTMGQVEEYRYFGVRTVEHMAELRDDVATRMMGAHALKQKAQAYLNLMKEEAPLKKVTAELESRDKEIEALKQAISEQGALIRQLQESKRK